MARIDWISLKKEYILGDYKSLNLFAENKGLNRNGNFNKQTKGWTEEKATKGQQKSNKIIEKTIEKEAVREADRNARHIALLDKVLDYTEIIVSEELNKGINNYGKKVTTELIQIDKLESVMKILEKAQKGHRLALGIDKEDKSNSQQSNIADELKKARERVANGKTSTSR